MVVNEFDARATLTMAEGDAIVSPAFGAPGIGKSRYQLFADSREIVDALDGVLRGVAVSTDITARRLAEQSLEQAKEQFRVLVENASDLIVMLNREGTLLFVSPSVEKQTGHRVDEMTGRSAFEMVHPADAPAVMKADAKAFVSPDAGFRIRFRLPAKTANGAASRPRARSCPAIRIA